MNENYYQPGKQGLVIGSSLVQSVNTIWNSMADLSFDKQFRCNR
jgi:hypothetical protein